MSSVCGQHPPTGAANYLVVELKQWARGQADPDDIELVHVDAYGDRPVLHPGSSRSLWTSCDPAT